MDTLKKTFQAVSNVGEDQEREVGHKGPVKPGDTILLTGATGFVAGHVLNSLLELGFKVKATVHSEEKADRLRELYSSRKGDLDVVVVEDITEEGSFDDAVRGVTGVVHAAYPHVPAKNGNKELLDQAISGATGVLESIIKHNPDIKRVVLTSSFAAMNDQHKGNWPGHTYSEGDWNPIKHEEALQAADYPTVYSASKTLAERAAWDFVSEHTKSTSTHPANFTLSTILLPAVIGPIAHDLTTTGSINTSVADIYRLISGCETKVPMNTLWAWADVRDVADAHVAALMSEGKEAGVEDRYFAAAGTYDYNEICKIIEQHFPELVREGGTPHSTDPNKTPYHYKVNNAKVKDCLGIEMRDLQDSIVDTVRSLLDYEERTKRGETKEVILAPVVTTKSGEKGKDLGQQEETKNVPYSIGNGKTACRCGGKGGLCTCPPETCACDGCTKKTEQEQDNEQVSREGARAARRASEIAEEEALRAENKGLMEVSRAARTPLEKPESEKSAEKRREAAEAAQNDKDYGKLSAKIDCDCGKGEDDCICPTETCSCRGCAKKRTDKAKFERSDFGNRPVSVGGGKTICSCGGNDNNCTCPPETCDCQGCGKRMADKKEPVVLNEPGPAKMEA